LASIASASTEKASGWLVSISPSQSLPSGTEGRMIRNVAPLPGVLSTWIRPPLWWTIP